MPWKLLLGSLVVQFKEEIDQAVPQMTITYFYKSDKIKYTTVLCL